jgi:hypothetical protein
MLVQASGAAATLDAGIVVGAIGFAMPFLIAAPMGKPYADFVSLRLSLDDPGSLFTMPSQLTNGSE